MLFHPHVRKCTRLCRRRHLVGKAFLSKAGLVYHGSTMVAKADAPGYRALSDSDDAESFWCPGAPGEFTSLRVLGA